MTDTVQREADRTTGGPPATQPGPTRRIAPFLVRRPESTIAIAGLALALYFALANDAFVTSGNLQIISQYVIPVAILAVGQTMLLISGEIDLSMGAVYFMAPFLVHFGHEAGIPLPLAIALALAGAGVVGLLNGGIIITFGIPSFVVTLGTLLIVSGFTLNISDGFPKRAPTEGAAVAIFGGARYSGFLWALAITAVMHVVLTRTRWGVYTIATGGNPTGAQESGVPTRRIRIRNFVVASMLAGFAGTLEGIRIGSFDPGAAIAGQKVFEAVAAAVIGGTLLTGGSGTVIGAFLGALVLATLRDGFIIEGVSAFTFNIVLGSAIIVAMVLNVLASRARTRIASTAR
ncbi:MAG: ABC transporter permease [Actinomycetota bacterium]|nr:ABC transporter permease [Actinomycetota bacterium]